MLYAGTSLPIPRKEWDRTAPGISVRSLVNAELPIREFFSKPEIQEIGSTSGCGCDFAFAMFQNGEWPLPIGDERDEETIESKRFNQHALLSLLKSIDEHSIELYGIWANNYEASPRVRETIDLERIVDAGFFFKEEGFLTVRLRRSL